MARVSTRGVNEIKVIKALNTPGGAAFEWRDETALKVFERCVLDSPVNDPLNAVHRGGVVGGYKAGWRFDRIGSNGSQLRATVYNTSDHAYYVEHGRGQSSGREVFSWTQTGGQIIEVLRGTGGYPAKNVLRDSANRVLTEQTDGAYIPLV